MAFVANDLYDRPVNRLARILSSLEQRQDARHQPEGFPILTISRTVDWWLSEIMINVGAWGVLVRFLVAASGYHDFEVSAPA